MFHSRRPLVASLSAIAFLSASALTAADTKPAFSSALTVQAVTAVCDATTTWQLAHPKTLADRPAGDWGGSYEPWDWTVATQWIGLSAYAQASGQQRWMDELRKVSDECGWRYGTRIGHADEHCMGQVYADLYVHDRIPTQLAHVREITDQYVAWTKANVIGKDPAKALHLPGETHYLDWSALTWCDTLFMCPPTVAWMTTATGDRNYLNGLDTVWWPTSDFLFNNKEGLFFRDDRYFTKFEKNGRPVFWSRGNGWVGAGLANLLQHVPADHPSRVRFESIVQRLAVALKTCQQADGSWHSGLLSDAADYNFPESSGTAFHCYLLLWGVNNGLLDRETYLPVALKAWDRLVKNVRADGALGFVQRIGFAPSTTSADTTEPFGTGGFLLAGSEMLNLVLLDGAKAARIEVANALDQPRLREVTSIPWADALAKLPGLTAANVAVRDRQTGRFVQTQVFDADGDGKPDELLFLATVLPKQTRPYDLVQVAGAQPSQLPSRLAARFVPERKDDFSWENDRIAFRTYGPALAVEGSRGGVDVWCKRTRDLVANDWFAHEQKEPGYYHNDHGTGRDCYKVGPGVGCGGVGYFNAADKTIVVSPVYQSWKLLAVGPLRLAFELTYPAQQVGKASIVETRRYTMELGDNLFRCESRFAVTGDASGVKPVTGLGGGQAPKMFDPQAPITWQAMQDFGVMALYHQPSIGTGTLWKPPVCTMWEPGDVGAAKAGNIGLALVVPPGNTDHAIVGWDLIVPLADSLKPVTWWAGAGWSKGLEGFHEDTWTTAVHAENARHGSPITVK
jgi:rhamnogalacturonyl hydrolase YesR